MRLIRIEDYKGEPLHYDPLTPEEEAQVYALGRESFTASDLQKFTEVDVEIPIEDVLADMEEQQQRCGKPSS